MWLFLCGVVASAAWMWTGNHVLRMFFGLFLSGPLLGTVWAASAHIKQYSISLKNLSDDPLPQTVAGLPYTLPGSPSYRLAAWLSLVSTWWQGAKSFLSRPLLQLVVSAIFSLTVAAHLGQQSLAITILALMIACAGVFGRGQWIFTCLVSIYVPLFMAWLLGHVTFAALYPASVAVAASFALAFCGYSVSNQTGRGLAWQAVPQTIVVASLIAYQQPVTAMVVALLGTPQLLLAHLLDMPAGREQYFRAIQWQLIASMLLTALALGYKL